MENTLKLLTFGVFDIFHAGHVYFLKQAAAYGLVSVAVLDDIGVEALKPGRPILTLEDRIEVLQACRYVDKVIKFYYQGDMVACHKKVIQETDFDVFVQGRQANHLLIYPILKELDIPIQTVDSRTDISTTEIIKKIGGL